MEIKIEGFQSIEKEIEIKVEGFTVITGESNVGKSAIVRSILGFLDSETGTSFINKHSSQTKVTITNRGHKASWIKDKKTTTYYIDNQEIKKAGRSAPKDLEKLGFFEVIAQGVKYKPQIQEQDAPKFILAEASPTVAAELLS